MSSGDRSHSFMPRMRPRLTPLLACLKAGTLISGRSDRYLHVQGDGSEVVLLVGWPRGGEDVDPCLFF